jgi:hypothetical protein
MDHELVRVRIIGGDEIDAAFHEDLIGERVIFEKYDPTLLSAYRCERGAPARSSR